MHLLIFPGSFPTLHEEMKSVMQGEMKVVVEEERSVLHVYSYSDWYLARICLNLLLVGGGGGGPKPIFWRINSRRLLARCLKARGLEIDIKRGITLCRFPANIH